MKKALFSLVGLLAFGAVEAADLAPASTQDGAAAAPAEAATETATETHGTVARAVFTSEVNNREPTDTISKLTNDATNISFFTELQGLQGQTVTHRWEHDNKVMAEVKFDVGGSRWRVYSSKNLDPSWTGVWKVSVLDANGGTLSASTFTYAPAPADQSAAPAAAPAATTTPAAAPATTQ